jgi:PKD repeat protein
MVPPTGKASRPTLRRTTTLMILGALTILLALPSGAFATSVSATAVSTTPVASIHTAPPVLDHTVASAAGAATLRAALAPFANSPGRSVLPAHRVPLYTIGVSGAAAASARDLTAATSLHAAISSLALGAGPADGVRLTCTSTSPTGASCAAPVGAVPHPAFNAYGWQNATPGSGIISGQIAGGAMAWDAFDEAIIYFGGCDAHSCPDNQTWGYYYGFWHNLTDFYGYNYAPTPVYEESMVYDYADGAVMMFGGCGLVVCPMNETWLFSGGFWYNASAPFCFSYYCYFAPAPRFGASMAFANDSIDNDTVLFGGCLDVFCYTYDDNTYVWVAYYEAWVMITPEFSPSPRAYASMAYDTEWGGLLLFGGCFYSCGLADTWSYYDGDWTNETSNNYYDGFATPQGRGAAQITYDTNLGELLLYGGVGGASTNNTWAWECGIYLYYYYTYACGWENITPEINLPGIIDLGASPQESSSYAPIMTGGDCSCLTTGALFETYVFEPLFTGAPTVSPNPAPTNTSVTFVANLSGGTSPYYGEWYPGASYYYYYGYGYVLNSAYNYSAAGAYTVELVAYDFYGVEFTYQTTEYVGTVAAQISVAHATTDVMASDAFSTPAASGGTAPYTYNWTFGDGSIGANADAVTHAYAAIGTYTANLTVTDTYGIWNTTSLMVTVGPAPAVTVAASAATVDLGSALTFTPTATGGVGPYTYSWAFGGGGTSTSTAPSYTYPAAGTYTATVTVTDSVGGTATGTVSVTVNPAVSGTVSATPASITAGGSVTYSAAGAGGSGTYTYSWVFGDGNHGTTASGTHVYANAGTYTAWVWINDTLGGSYSHSVTITVTAPSSSTTTSSGLGGWGLWAGIGIVIIIIAAIAIVMLTRRRKPTPAPGSSMPPTGAAGGPGTPPPPPGAQ